MARILKLIIVVAHRHTLLNIHTTFLRQEKEGGSFYFGNRDGFAGLADLYLYVGLLYIPAPTSSTHPADSRVTDTPLCILFALLSLALQVAHLYGVSHDPLSRVLVRVCVCVCVLVCVSLCGGGGCGGEGENE